MNLPTTTRRSFLGSTAACGAGALLSNPAFSATIPVRPSGPLQAGAALVDITPGADVPLQGPIGGSGLADVVHDPLHARAIVLDNGATRIAICVCDVTMIADKYLDRAKELIRDGVGIPVDRVLLSATHTHRAPRCTDLDLGEAHERYKDSLPSLIAKAVSAAAGRLAPARVGWGIGHKPELCRNRRWLVKPGTLGPDPFGEFNDKVRMWSKPGPSAIRTVGPTDPELAILSVQHTDGRPLALLANFNIHYGVGGKGVSADYFGKFCDRIEERFGGDGDGPPMVGIMTNGTSGNIGSGGDPDKLAGSLFAEAVRVYGKIEHRDALPLVAEESVIRVGIRRPNKERVEWARQVLDGTWDKPAHPWKERYAHSALWLNEYPAEAPVRLQALRIGDLGISAIPCEVFAETGLAIKEESPLKPTFTISLANGYWGYLPPPDQFELGGYTTWPAVSSCLEEGAEPKIKQEALRLLERVSVG